MSGILIRTAAISSLLLVSACAGVQLLEAEVTRPSGSEFDAQLHKGYLALSESRFSEGDFTNAGLFADRAVQAASGTGVNPEAIDARKLPDEKVAELSRARGRLVRALAGGSARKNPADSARAQVMFDCWMQEQEVNAQAEDIQQCRSEFLTALAKIKTASRLASPTPKPIAKTGAYVVFFEFNKADLTPDAKTVLTRVVHDAKETKVSKVVASGYTDSIGAADYNARLAKRRADAVASFLLKSGIEKENLLVDAYGENLPAVAPGDGVSEARNRRVEIRFSR